MKWWCDRKASVAAPVKQKGGLVEDEWFATTEEKQRWGKSFEDQGLNISGRSDDGVME